jgi:hypothetical protein
MCASPFDRRRVDDLLLCRRLGRFGLAPRVVPTIQSPFSQQTVTFARRQVAHVSSGRASLFAPVLLVERPILVTKRDRANLARRRFHCTLELAAGERVMRPQQNLGALGCRSVFV